MNKQKRLLDIETCNRCKYLDVANSGRVGYTICTKENRVITTGDERRIDMILCDVLIPEWCTLPIAQEIKIVGRKEE